MHNYTNLNIISYLLFNVHQTEKLLEHDYFSAFDKDALVLLLEAVKDFSDKELFPFIKEMDEKPSYFKDGKIIVHPQFETILKQAAEMDLVSAIYSFEEGGMQLPASVFHCLYYIMEAANNQVTGYLGLTTGAANLILSFGSQHLKDTYASKMLKMEWGGTMCLTEPQAGSSLSDVKTLATKVADTDYYLIEGQKIFISAGDHQFADNFVHLVLGRVKGAPAGTKGVSLFVVPNKRPLGNDFEDNDAAVLGEFEKMGQRGYCTTHLSFGDNNRCRGWLVGEENKGLSYMFLLMNEARIATGRMGAGIASAAYYASLKYANERPQGRLLNNSGKKDSNSEQTLIINHPDVKRMLLMQRAIVEGSLSLIIQTSQYVDLSRVCDDSEKEKYNLLLELLTPIVKTYPSEQGLKSVSNGLQILGGYGFCSDFILQQYYRDIRILSIYEGTTGIQSLDLLGRKVTMKNGKALHYLVEEMTATVTEAYTLSALKPYAGQLKEQSELVKTVLAKLIPKALSGDFENYLADASIFMDFLSTLVIGWQWLKIGVTAEKSKSNADNKTGLEDNLIHTMAYYYTYEMAKLEGLAKILLNDKALTVKAQADTFD
ncbi:MAG: acyl-CoA dehydrogenase [Flavobacteriales bacterium]|nr:acyl-CoA dehydrogenase [Flavobacteriales bacterium]